VPGRDVTPVYVDDGLDSGTPGWGVDHCATIWEGIDAVSVAGGTCTEALIPRTPAVA